MTSSTEYALKRNQKRHRKVCSLVFLKKKCMLTSTSDNKHTPYSASCSAATAQAQHCHLALTFAVVRVTERVNAKSPGSSARAERSSLKVEPSLTPRPSHPGRKFPLSWLLALDRSWHRTGRLQLPQKITGTGAASRSVHIYAGT